MNRPCPFLPCLLSLLVLLSPAGCSHHEPTPPPPSPPPPVDPGDPVAVVSACSSGCKHLRDLKCKEGNPTPDGATCEAWCGKYKSTAVGVNPTCLGKVTTCAGVDACGR